MAPCPLAARSRDPAISLSIFNRFFSTLTNTTRRRGPSERVHFEGRSLVAINGERRMTLAVINEDGVWVDDSGTAWIDLDVQPSPP